MLQTEFGFTLPSGYVDAQGNLHCAGVMRRATAHDEVAAFADPRVERNPAFYSVLLLSRVITRLGTLAPVGTAIIEGLFASDFVYLQDLYLQLNDGGGTLIETECPHCGMRFTLSPVVGNET